MLSEIKTDTIYEVTEKIRYPSNAISAIFKGGEIPVGTLLNIQKATDGYIRFYFIIDDWTVRNKYATSHNSGTFYLPMTAIL